MIKIGLMNFENSSDSSDALLSLIEEIKLGYQPPEEVLRRGRKPDFSPLSFLLLAVVAVVTKTFSDSELRRFLEKDRELRARLGFSRTPHRVSDLCVICGIVWCQLPKNKFRGLGNRFYEKFQSRKPTLK